MINMHHCRFQNTLDALRECCETLEYEEVSDLSESEQKALAQLLRLCGKMVRFYEPTPDPASEPDPVPTKLCTNCGVEKPLTDFNLKPSGGPLSSCKCCRNATRRALRARFTENLTAKIVADLRTSPMSASELAARHRASRQVIGRTVAAHGGIRSMRKGTAMIYRLVENDNSAAPKRGRGRPRMSAPAPVAAPVAEEGKTKTCTKCKQTLPISQFRFRLADCHYRRNQCKSCSAEYDKKKIIKRAALIDGMMPAVFELLTQHGPMQATTIIALMNEKQPDLKLTYRRLYAAIVNWSHTDRIERRRDRRDLGYVYRVAGDTRPVFFENSALENEHPPAVERAVDDPEGDAWWASLQAEVAERKARRARMQW